MSKHQKFEEFPEGIGLHGQDLGVNYAIARILELQGQLALQESGTSEHQRIQADIDNWTTWIPPHRRVEVFGAMDKANNQEQSQEE